MLNNLVGSDVVTLASGSTSTYASANVGTRIVTVSGLGLEGTDSSNYTLTQPTVSSADITVRTLSVTANDQSLTYGVGLGSSAFTP